MFQSFDKQIPSDKKRKQIIGDTRKCILPIQQSVEKLITSAFANVQLSYPNATTLLSLRGCGRQAYHYDFNSEHPHSSRSYACLVALMDQTQVYGLQRIHDSEDFEEVAIKLSAGDVLVFRGDFIHAGSDYTDTNIRLHFYFDQTARRPDWGELRAINTTYNAATMSQELNPLQRIKVILNPTLIRLYQITMFKEIFLQELQSQHLEHYMEFTSTFYDMIASTSTSNSVDVGIIGYKHIYHRHLRRQQQTHVSITATVRIDPVVVVYGGGGVVEPSQTSCPPQTLSLSADGILSQEGFLSTKRSVRASPPPTTAASMTTNGCWEGDECVTNDITRKLAVDVDSFVIGRDAETLDVEAVEVCTHDACASKIARGGSDVLRAGLSSPARAGEIVFFRNGDGPIIFRIIDGLKAAHITEGLRHQCGVQDSVGELRRLKPSNKNWVSFAEGASVTQFADCRLRFCVNSKPVAWTADADPAKRNHPRQTRKRTLAEKLEIQRLLASNMKPKHIATLYGGLSKASISHYKKRDFVTIQQASASQMDGRRKRLLTVKATKTEQNSIEI